MCSQAVLQSGDAQSGDDKILLIHAGGTNNRMGAAFKT